MTFILFCMYLGGVVNVYMNTKRLFSAVVWPCQLPQMISDYLNKLED